MDKQSSFSSGEMNGTLISALDEIHKPEVYNKLVGRYPKQRDLGFLKTMGWHKRVNQETFTHHEENTLFQSPVIEAANASGSNVLITLSADDHQNSGRDSFPRVGNLVEFTNGTSGFISAKDETTDSAHVITVKPVNAAQDVNAAAEVGANIMIPSNAGNEGGSGFDDILVPTTEKFDHQLQIFREKHKVTSSEEENETWITFKNPNTGESEARYYIKGEADTADRFLMQEELGLFTSNKSDGTLTDAAGNIIRTTQGFIPQLKERAPQMDYTSQPSKETYDRMCKIINKNYGGSEYILAHGLDYAIGNSNFSNDFGQSGGIVYSNTGGKDRAISMGFNSISVNGTTFHLKSLPILSHADTTGASGFGYSAMSIAIPTDKQIDPKSLETMNPCCVRYKKMGGKGSRGNYKVWETGGSSAAGTNSELNRVVNYASEKGFQLFGAKRFILNTKK